MSGSFLTATLFSLMAFEGCRSYSFSLISSGEQGPTRFSPILPRAFSKRCPCLFCVWVLGLKRTLCKTEEVEISFFLWVRKNRRKGTTPICPYLSTLVWFCYNLVRKIFYSSLTVFQRHHWGPPLSLYCLTLLLQKWRTGGGDPIEQNSRKLEPKIYIESSYLMVKINFFLKEKWKVCWLYSCLIIIINKIKF